MSAAKISHVVFDIGGVLMDWSPDYLYRKVIPDEARRRFFLQQVCTPAWNAGQDKGRTWKAAEDEILPQYPEFRDEILAYRARWIEMIAGPIEGGLELLRDVRATSVPVSYLSNWAADTFEVTCERYPVLLTVADRTVSGQIGMAKPDAEIFVHHEQTFDLVANETLFIDDNADNIEAARARGWQAIQFKDAATTRRQLIETGVLAQ